MNTVQSHAVSGTWWRRAQLWCGAASLTVAALTGTVLTTPTRAADAPADHSVKIGIIGAGKMGATLARLWSEAGYPVTISSRNPGGLQSLAQSIGHGVRAATPQGAAEFGKVVVVAIPYSAEPKLGQELHAQLAGKIVIDLGNPYPDRDGPMAVEARQQGTGTASAGFFPNVKLVRAFNAISYVSLGKNAHRTDPPAIPIATDDPGARAVTEQLVRDAGFAPVFVGPLSKAKTFDVGTPVYVKDLTENQTRSQLGLPAH